MPLSNCALPRIIVLTRLHMRSKAVAGPRPDWREWTFLARYAWCLSPLPRQAPHGQPAGAWGCPALTDRADGLSGYLPEVLLSGSGFVFGGAAIAEGAVQAGAVVPADVLDDGPPCPGPGGPGLQVEQFALGRVEERLGQGVIPALARAPDRQGDLVIAG
jgi:hypothetical protein